jgi:hypothetical protein
VHFQETPSSVADIMKMTRRELWDYLESRGFAVYSDESTKELREAAIEDSDPNYFKHRKTNGS